MMKFPNTVAVPAPEPAMPTMAAPAPMHLAAVPMSLEMALLQLRLGISEVRGHRAAKLLRLLSVSVSGAFSTAVDINQCKG